MRIQYCPSCEKWIGFKRSLGFGTLFMVFLTMGFWILTIPFYPKRCVSCGGDVSTAFQGDYKLRKEVRWKQTKEILKACLAILIALAAFWVLGTLLNICGVK